VELALTLLWSEVASGPLPDGLTASGVMVSPYAGLFGTSTYPRTMVALGCVITLIRLTDREARERGYLLGALFP